jgi:sec-independent protein translocase protein TatA
MSPSVWQIAIVALLIVLLFGRGKLSALMGDMAKGIKNFKQGMQDDGEATTAQRETIRDGSEAQVVNPTAKDEAAKS